MMDLVNEFLVSYLDAIEKRLLEYFDQDDRCTAPWLPSQGDRGRAPAMSMST
jgi:hypothetical protein